MREKPYVPVRFAGFYFSTSADRSANDYTFFADVLEGGEVARVGARYKNAEPSGIYQIECDSDDLRLLASQLKNLADIMDAMKKAQGEA